VHDYLRHTQLIMSELGVSRPNATMSRLAAAVHRLLIKMERCHRARREQGFVARPVERPPVVPIHAGKPEPTIWRRLHD
jgi:hypothetical protein